MRLRSPMHVYEVRQRKDQRGVDLISDALPFGRLWYGEPDAISNAIHRSRSHDALIRVYDDAGNVIQTHEHEGDFREWQRDKKCLRLFVSVGHPKANIATK